MQMNAATDVSGRRWLGRLGLAAVVVLLLCVPARAGDWPAYRHDARRSAVTDEMPAFPMRLAWSYACAQPPRPAWPDSFRLLNRMDFDYAPPPVIAEGIVCFGSSSDDSVRALEVKTGREKWHFITGGPVRFAPQIVSGRVYFASDDGFVYCVDATSGLLSWKRCLGPQDERMVANHRMISRWPVRTGVLVADGVVYAAAGMLPSEGTFIYALDAHTGKVIWCNDTSGGTPQGALLANDKLLLVPNANQGMRQFDRRTGKMVAPLRRGDQTGMGGTWATIDGDKLYSYAMHRANVLFLQPMALTDAEVGRPWGAGVVPQITLGPQPGVGQIHERARVSAIVRGGKPYIRKALGMALAGDALVLGHDGSVVAERTGPLKSAELRFGVAGDDLLVHAGVIERNVTQASTPWKGSCIEVFGSLPGQKPIGQVFLVPQTHKDPARAYRSQDGKFVPAPEIRVQTVMTSTGYELAALIPLAMLALDKTSSDFLLEVQVTVTGHDATLQRDTLFGSTAAYQDNQKFNKLRLKPLETSPNPGEVKAALAGATAYAITMRGAGELWSTQVNGEAREIAVADGRLFVSTHRGVIYCFEPMAKDAPPAIVHDPVAKMPKPAPRALVPVIESVKAVGMDRGFAMVLGDADGRLSMALAAETQLQIINAVTDESAVAALRERLFAETAWYGSRIHVQTLERLDRLPFAQYFANTVIVAGTLPGISGKELYRVLRPCGGIMLLPGLSAPEKDRCFKDAGAVDGEVTQSRNEPCIVRGKIPGALDWNTNRKDYTVDQRVKWPLRPLWIGGPSTAQVQNFGEDARGPIAANGRYFVISEHLLTAVDAYNGEILWSRPIPKKSPAVRAVNGVLYVASDPPHGGAELVRYIRANDNDVTLDLGTGYFKGKGGGWVRLDARTGEQHKQRGVPFNPPTPLSLAGAPTWPIGVDAAHSGSVAIASTLVGLTLTLTTKDPAVTPLDGWDLYFDFRPIDSRYGLYDRDAFHVRVAVMRDEKTPASWTPGNAMMVPKIEVSGTREPDGTKTTVLLPWAELENIVGVRPTSCDFAATLNSHEGGANEPIVRRHLFGDWAAEGINNGWGRIALTDTPSSDIDKPLAVVVVPATQPAAAKPIASAASSLPKFIPAPDEINTPGQHPLTGEPVPKITGLAPMCGGTTSTLNLIFGQHRVYDLADNSGVRSLYGLSGVKTGCSTPQLAALGLMIVSEERGHCVCNYAYHTTVVMAPAERRLNEDWAQFYDRDVDTVVRQAHINLGAPGDRRDSSGDLWLGYPRADALQKPEEHPNPDHPLPYPQGMRDAQTGLWYRRPVRTAMGLPLKLEVAEGMGPYRFNADRAPVGGTDHPWIYSSGYRGIRKVTVRLNFHQPLSSMLAPTGGGGAITVDGKLDEACWVDELRATDAAPATLLYTSTRVLFRHDDQNLYVGATRPPMSKWGRTARVGATAGFQAQTQPWQKGNSGRQTTVVDRLGRESKEKVENDQTGKAAGLSARDNWWRLIVSDKSARQAVYLTVTPDGTRAIALYDEAKKKLDRTWNPQWASAVVADDKGMVIEMAIPWTLLEQAGLHKDELAVNCFMYDPGLGTEALTYLGIDGMDHCTNFTPLGLGKPRPIEERLFTVRLHFAEPDAVKPRQRVFNVKIQGQDVLKDFDIAKEAGVNTAIVKEVKHVKATSEMTVEFVSPEQTPTATTAPILSALEFFEENTRRMHE